LSGRPERMRHAVREMEPDAVIVMFGGNDSQDMNEAGRHLERFSPEWIDAYHRRVGEAMDILVRGGTRVYWVGMPISRPQRFREWCALMNGIYQQEAETRDAVRFVDCWTLFAGDNGMYAAHLPDGQGKRRLMRTEDGIHLTSAGGDRLAALVWSAMQQDFDLRFE